VNLAIVSKNWNHWQFVTGLVTIVFSRGSYPSLIKNTGRLRCKLLSTALGGYSVNFETFDASYVSKLREGDAPTEQHFISYFSELIGLKLRSRLRNREQIEDLKQETFSRTLSLIRTEGGLRHAERLGPLVNSICNNVLMEQYRISNRVENLEDGAAERLVETRPNALNIVISDDTRKLVRQILNDLNERDRKLLQAVFLEERDKDEICVEFGVDRDYLRVLLHRAKSSFRAMYSKQANAKRLTLRT
jgi:RNA polymerase sigma-70 factor, ECF subfamily